MDQGESKQGQVTVRGGINLSHKAMLVIGVAVELLFLVIGAGTRNEPVARIGTFVSPLALLAGGLLLEEEYLVLRVTLVAIGGLFAIAAYGGLSLIPAFLR